MRCCDHLVVGIFSREDRKTYEWLIRTVTFIIWVKKVQPILITNNQSDFTEQVPKCSFGILYHSKTRGRLNITDVTDSLYDDELQQLSRAYGRNNVIVVVGDVEDSSNERKALILGEQRKLGEYASNVFLFNEVKDDRAPFEGPKIEDLKNKIKKRAFIELCKRSFIWLMFLAVLLLIGITVVGVRFASHPKIPSTLSPPVNVTITTSHFISNMTTTPSPSTIANITLVFTSQTTNATAHLLVINKTSTVKAKP